MLSLKTMNESKKEEHGQQPVQFCRDKYEYTQAEKDFEMDQDQLIQDEEEDEEEPYEFPESTFTFLITENVFSFGFATAILTQILSLTCLFLAFKNQMSAGSSGNDLGLQLKLVKKSTPQGTLLC